MYSKDELDTVSGVSAFYIIMHLLWGAYIFRGMPHIWGKIYIMEFKWERRLSLLISIYLNDQTTFNYLQHTQGLILWSKELPQDGNIETNNIEGLALATADSKLKINFMCSWNVPIWLPKLNPICIKIYSKELNTKKNWLSHFYKKIK